MNNHLKPYIAILNAKIVLLSTDTVPCSIIDLLNQLVRSLQDGTLSHSDKETKLLIDYVWERLNIGHWKDVDIAWRYVYSLAGLIRTLAFYQAKDLHSALAALDNGLLMGAPLDEINSMALFASKLHAELRSTSCGEEGVEAPCVKKRKITPKPVLISEYVSSFTPKLSESISRRSNLDFLQFSNDFFAPQIPVVIENAVSDWKAVQKWSVEYIVEVAGFRTVPVEVGSKYTDDSWGQKLMTVNEFVETYMGSAPPQVAYVAQHELFDQIVDLADDFHVPEFCAVGEKGSVEVNAWFGPKGTVSPLHFDPKDNILAQCFGSKVVRLIAPKDSTNVYPIQDGRMGNTSQVDVERPDFDMFPLFDNVTVYDCILRAGECLFIPKHWWHYVRSLEPSFSISFWFD